MHTVGFLASESADVTTQLDAGSTAAVSTVATNLNSVVSAGTLAVGYTVLCMLCCAFELAQLRSPLWPQI